jgi:hypothetical protein
MFGVSMKRVNLCVPQQRLFHFPYLIASASKTFTRIPTRTEWSRFQKYARGMRSLKVNASKDLLAPDVFSTLQLRTGNDPLLPRLDGFECDDTTEAFAPLIPIFLPPKVVVINIRFAANVPVVTIASIIVRLPILCTEVRSLYIWSLPRNAVITEAVSEMVLACNPKTLRAFLVFSPLTEEARKVLHQLPNLRHLGTVMGGRHRYLQWHFRTSPGFRSNMTKSITGCKRSMERDLGRWTPSSSTLRPQPRPPASLNGLRMSRSLRPPRTRFQSSIF